ncbi:MAG: conserved hypothetical protein, membrane [Candidatus Syntrophoarchaeum caldarius]|uniref:Uncharacterized protein n=1 Tax=Candidatus Syntropharchaeum caldarium TaxID=1838285 RepID=A0A1F2P9T3_9EURY|nr:MAG: conserved hypothetical protein, membrane [Candidatus Syntrophoarchaeum caldarius]
MDRVAEIEEHVHIGRKGTDSIEFDRDELKLSLQPGEETSFTVTISNYTIPTHVHFALDRELRDFLTIINENPYVRTEEKIPIVVRVPKDSTEDIYSGRVHVISGYGSVKGSFTVTISVRVEKPEMNGRFEEKAPIRVSIPRKSIKRIKIKDKVPLGILNKKTKLSRDVLVATGITSLILIFLTYLFIFNPASFGISLLTSILVMLLVFYIFNIYRGQR